MSNMLGIVPYPDLPETLLRRTTTRSERRERLVSNIDIRYSTPMVLPSDVYILAGLITHRASPTFRALGDRLGVPVSLVQRALDRAAGAALYEPGPRRVHRANFDEFLRHAVRFVAPAALGELVAGVPAGWAAPPMAALIHESGDAPPPVWPSAEGSVRGRALLPLHKSAVDAAADHRELAELLAVIDSLRAGDVRIRSVAADQIRPMLGAPDRQ
jgi:hypothetical protein